MKIRTPYKSDLNPRLTSRKQGKELPVRKHPGLGMQNVAEQYLSCRLCSADYRVALVRVARSLEEFGITDPSALDSVPINRWLSALPRSPTTVGNYRRMAVTLWRFAHARGLAPKCSEDVIRVKPPARPPVCWTAEELSRLMDYAAKMPGHFRTSGCPESLFWPAWVLIGYETGIRMMDLLNLRSSQFRGNRLYVVHHKTGVSQGKILSDTALEFAHRLMAMNKGSGTVFRWALSRKHVFLRFKKLVQAAGLDGSTKFLRRSGATFCEIKQPGSAKAFLGHLSEGLARRYYIDATLVSQDIPTPPPFLTPAN